MVRQCKPSARPWPGLLGAGVLGCYSPEVGEEFYESGAGGQLGTNVRSNTPPPGSLPPPAFLAPLSPTNGGHTSLSAGGSGETTMIPPPPREPPLPPAGCTPRLAVPPALPAACAGEAYFARLQLECSEAAGAPVTRGVQWLPSSLPAGLALSEQGELLGGAALSAGVHTLQARARIAGAELPVSLQLEVLERCFLFVAARAEEPAGPTRILAQRLDAAQSRWLPESLTAGSEVLSFDRSADGRWLAAVSTGPAGERLSLFHVDSGHVRELQLQHAGAHVAHTFSANSARLAVVTELAAGVGAPPDRRLSLVELNLLEPSFSEPSLLEQTAPGAEQPALTLEEAFALPYQTGLGWADEDTLQLIGLSAQFPSYFAPQLVRVPDAGLNTAELSELLYPMDPADLIRWFQPLPGGFYVMTNALTYVDEAATVAGLHLMAQALSPTYQLSAHTLDGRLQLHAPEVSDDQPATFSADGCERLLAWSGDGQTLLCALEGGLARLRLGDGALTATRLRTVWPAGGTQRSVVSQQGQWALVADAEHGVFLLAGDQPPPTEPLLAAAPAETGWDFAISRDERHLWVQQGQRLSVAALVPAAAGEPVQLTLLSDAMAAPSTCAPSGLPLPDEWCGAAELQGRVRLRADGRYLAFADAGGDLTLVDLAAPGRRLRPGARLSSTCSKHCMQFQ